MDTDYATVSFAIAVELRGVHLDTSERAGTFSGPVPVGTMGVIKGVPMLLLKDETKAADNRVVLQKIREGLRQIADSDELEALVRKAMQEILQMGAEQGGPPTLAKSSPDGGGEVG